MASNREKLLDSAQKFIFKGQLDRAIKDYQQVVAIDPKDTRHRQRLAELLVRTGRNDEAVTEYEFIGKFYDDNGYYLKAIAVYKQIQKLTPDNIKISVVLGALNGKQGLMGNALDEYRTAVNHYEKNAQLAEAVKIVEKMLELDPENPATCQKHAELLFARREVDAAFDAYTNLIKLLKKSGNLAAAEKIETRMANLFPDRAKVTVEDLAALVKSDADSAIDKLSARIKQDSTNLPLWKLLIEAYEVKNDLEKLKLTYELVIRLFPGELFAREKIIRLALAQQKLGDAVELLAQNASAFLDQSAFDPLESLYLNLREHSDDERIIAGLMDLYRRSGDAEKLSALESSLQPPALETEEEVAPVEEPPPLIQPIETPEQSAGTAAHPGLAESEAAEPERGEDWEEDVYLSIDDEDDITAELAELEEDDLTAEHDALAPEEEILAMEDSNSFDEDDFAAADEVIAAADLELAVMDDDILLSEPESATEESEAEALDLAEEAVAEEDLTEEASVEEVSADHLVLSQPDAELEMELSPESCEIIEELDEPMPLDLADDLSGEEESGYPEAADLLELDTEDLVEQGHLVLLPEDTDELPELSLLQIEGESSEEEALLGLDISKGIDQLFEDLEESPILEEEHSVTAKVAKYSWDGMLSEPDEQASLGDAETHFDLGIAYREMGLYDDAIGEFRRASVSPARKLDCVTLQAACYRDKGEYEQAEHLLLETMGLQGLAEEETLGLKFELALLFEGSGRLAEAVDIFREVERANPDFRGVAEKIASLEGKSGSLDLAELEYEEIEELVEMSDSGGQ